MADVIKLGTDELTKGRTACATAAETAREGAEKFPISLGAGLGTIGLGLTATFGTLGAALQTQAKSIAELIDGYGGHIGATHDRFEAYETSIAPFLESIGLEDAD
ncbi:hypothetical protein [Leucobacter japonicus]|uniref:hypothetical protein n=1 Tax=Leucobacter japonicus TaxID=1461259 RepID=UPI0006A77F1C|nr:hypothetical protein [Leucobacter japonicus]